MSTTDRFERLKPFARTMRQTELLELIIECGGNMTEAARRLDMASSSIVTLVQRVERTAALQGHSPDHDMTKVCPDTHYLKGTSTLYGEDGKPKLQWVKTNAKLQDELECLREFAEGLAEGIEPVKPIELTTPTMSDLLTVYPLADIHFGMLAWRHECLEDYDLKIAQRAMSVAANSLVAKTEPSKHAIVANLGDFFHFDNDDRQTKASGAKLDGDGRWSKVVRLGVAGLKNFIAKALEKHEKVHVINSIGNHDDQTALMLPLILEPHYQNEPRVTIETAPQYYHYYEFGANLLGFHHGHRCSPAKLPALLVADMREAVGRTKYSHWLTGHIHHETKEYDGCLVESFRTLAAKDAFHASHGYRALRDIQAITYHREFGECARARVSYDMIKALTPTD